MESLWQDFRQGARALSKAPRFALIVIITLGIGIAANTIIFSIADSLFLRGIPYPDASRLIFLSRGYPGSLQGGGKFTYPEFRDIQQQNISFDAMAAHQAFGALALTGVGEPVRVAVSYATPAYFELLGVHAALGRIFRAQEDHLDGAAPVVLLSYGFWQRQFGGAPDIVGRTITLNQLPFTVVGILPGSFHDSLAEQDTDEATNAWIPLGLAYSLTGMSNPNDRLGSVLWGVAHLKPGVRAEDARKDVDAIGKRLEQTYPESDKGYTLVARPLKDQLLGEFYGPAWLLIAGSAFILLIGCVNVGNLLLARLVSRRRELAVRSALGASSGRLVRHLMAENVVLMILSGILGIILAAWGVDALRGWGGHNLPSLIRFQLDGSVLLTSIAITLFTGLLFGVTPALLAVRVDLREALNQSGRQGTGLGRRRGPRILVAVEVALAMVLLIAAGLLMKSFRSLVSSNLGFDTANLLTLRLDLRSQRYALPAARAEFTRQLLEKLQSIPGVRTAMIWGPGMLGRAGWVVNLTLAGRPLNDPDATLMVSSHSVNPGALHNLGIPLLRGRDFTWQDSAASTPVIIVSESAARQLWPNEDPLGQHVHGEGSYSSPITVIGIAADARHRQRLNLTDAAIGIPPSGLGPQFDGYFPYLQRANAAVIIAVRISGAEASVAREIKNAVLSLDSTLPVYDIALLDDRLSGQVATNRALTALTGGFAAVALFLAAFGLFGVLAHAVGQRTHEIGIRLALGALPRDVLGLIVREGMLLTLLGMAAGFAGSLFVTRAMESILFGVSTTDPAVLACIAILLLASAALACWLPARSAMRLDPMSALRGD